MRKLSDTLARIAAFQNAQAWMPSGQGDAGRLEELSDFGSNPGALTARVHIPEGLAEAAPLVVVLHGCTQNAAGYDKGSGWSDLADRHGFALLFPEQSRANNPNLCFNWFAPDDNRRDAGEALSIRQMIAALVDMYAIDPKRIFVTGLSAGGAMTSVMLATYPELFAGGAIIAGLPYAIAASVPQALDRMRGHGGPADAELAGLVRAASPHKGPWPTISIWHGSGDATVSPANADAIVAQWAPLHGVAIDASEANFVDGYPHRVWRDASGRAVIEDYSITGMGHGTPLETGGEDGYGAAGAYMLEVSISSTRRIAGYWGLIDAVAEQAAPKPKRVAKPRVAHVRKSDETAEAPADRPAVAGVGKVIEDALRAAGLMR